MCYFVLINICTNTLKINGIEKYVTWRHFRNTSSWRNVKWCDVVSRKKSGINIKDPKFLYMSYRLTHTKYNYLSNIVAKG